MIELENILGDPKNRNALKNVILEYDVDKCRFDSSIDDVLFILNKRKPLYNKWVQVSGNKKRELSVPKNPLKIFLGEYILPLIKSKDVHKSCHGGEKGWSVKKSLETHLPCASVLSYDLKSAFQNISFEHVVDFFSSLLSDISEDNRKPITYLLSMLNTTKYSDGKRALPQGSPCSMALFNRILFKFDVLLAEKSNERRFRYSRWVDDITISSQNEQEPKLFLGAIYLTELYFPVAKDKLFFQKEDSIYLLGHKFVDGEVMKNSESERLKNKSKPFEMNEVNYSPWVNEDANVRMKMEGLDVI